MESLEAAPPVTFATRSWDSSTFRSSSCFSSSSFFLPRRSRALILACAQERVKSGQTPAGPSAPRPLTEASTSRPPLLPRRDQPLGGARLALGQGCAGGPARPRLGQGNPGSSRRGLAQACFETGCHPYSAEGKTEAQATSTSPGPGLWWKARSRLGRC